MANQTKRVDLWLYCEGYNNVLSRFKIVVFGPLMNYQDWLSLVIQTPGQRPATLKDFRTQELALERQTQFAKLRKELTLAQREISNLKNQLHQAKENIAKERAERGSKSK
jgi:hypothetical protein